MTFSSPLFIFLFFPVVLCGYYSIDKNYKNYFLLAASIFFYAWSGIYYLILILTLVLINYILGRIVTGRKNILILSLIINIGTLGFFKYLNFFTANLENLCQTFSIPVTVVKTNIPLPIGISFFTFQIMSYVIDVYRNKVPSQKSFTDLALYIMMFPQLVAGPIVRYIDIEKELHNRKMSFKQFNSGMERFIIGFAKKILLSNNIGFVADKIFTGTSDNSIISWVGIICYTLQIYFDFSGYSDMAIGMGQMFGFHFLENFNYPYISKSIKEFWRRWHISLSSWFRDYLYIPLGGNKKGKFRTYVNLMIVFFITGFWHGASWNFIVWGLFHGFFLVLERGIWGNILEKLPNFIKHFYTMLVVMIAWVFFKVENMQDAFQYIHNLFAFQLEGWEELYFILDWESIFFILVGLIFSTKIVWSAPSQNLRNRLKNTLIFQIAYFSIFFTSVIYMLSSGFNPFIYFRF